MVRGNAGGRGGEGRGGEGGEGRGGREGGEKVVRARGKRGPFSLPDTISIASSKKRFLSGSLRVCSRSPGGIKANQGEPSATHV